jgi:hypothetical protein
MTTGAVEAAWGSNSCAALGPADRDELTAVSHQYHDAHGLFIKLIGWAGEKAESAIQQLPAGWQDRIGEASHAALKTAYAAALYSQPDCDADGLWHRATRWSQGERWHLAATAASGAIGGLGGIATALADLPVATTLILRSVQQIAAEHGEDVADPQVRAQCLAVFAMGGPLPEDDAGPAGLWATRLALTGKTVAEMLVAVAPRFGVAVSQKALAQATPLIGAAVGAAVNPLFTRYYQQMAHVHFRLRRIERRHDADQVRSCLEQIVAALRAVDAEAVARMATRRTRGSSRDRSSN